MSAVNSVDAQKVQDDGQEHHQRTSEEEIVVVDKRKAEPAAVGLPDSSLPEVPEWQESGFIQNCAQRPLHLSVVHQLRCLQVWVVVGEVEPLVQDFIHPS